MNFISMSAVMSFVILITQTLALKSPISLENIFRELEKLLTRRPRDRGFETALGQRILNPRILFFFTIEFGDEQLGSFVEIQRHYFWHF